MASKTNYVAPPENKSISIVLRKPDLRVYDMARHKLACAATEHGYMFQISDIETREVVLCWY